MVERRWDGDTAGRGIGTGAAIIPLLNSFAEQASGDGWLTEDPVSHLLPHIREAAIRAGLTVVRTSEADGVLMIDVSATNTRPRDVRAGIFALVGSFAESDTSVHERVSDGGREYDVATGMRPGEGGFAGHGHLVRFRVIDGGP